jgi:ankyrin repeat protein
LEAGAHINEIGEQSNNTPLMGAAGKSQVHNIHTLIAAGAPIFSVEALLHLGANPNAADNRGISALQRSLSTRYTSVITRHLLENGANVNHVALDGTTPLDAALALGEYETVEAVLRAGADINRAKQRDPPASASDLVQRYLREFNGKASMDLDVRWMRRRHAIRAWQDKWESSSPQASN